MAALTIVEGAGKDGQVEEWLCNFPDAKAQWPQQQTAKYVPGEIDLFVVYCPGNAKIYFWQFGDNPRQGYLRYSETRNRQRQKVRQANDYEFEKRIDDLRKEVELRGFEPLTS